MTLLPVSEMHGDHQTWEAENALWHDQLREWQRETDQAIAEMAQIEQALRSHERQLEVHAAAVRLKGNACDRHEHELAQAAQKQEHVCTGGGHCRETRDQNEERRRHERLKRTHHTLMARWSLLLKSLQEAAS